MGPAIGPDGKPLVDAESEVARQETNIQAPTAADVGEAPPSAQIAEQGAAAVHALGQVATKAAAPRPSAPAPHRPDPLPPPDPAAATAAEAAAPAAAAVAQRDVAMASAAQSAAQLETVRSGAGAVASVSVRYGGEGGAAAAASEMVSGFLGMVGARAAEVSELGADVPERLRTAASQTVDQVGAAVAERSQAIADQVAQLRAGLQAQADSAHESVLSQHAATTAAVASSTAAAREQLQTELTNALQAIDAKETAQLAVIEAKYRAGDERFRAAGRTVGAEAVQRGDQMATEYMRGLVDEDDSWLDGPLTYNRGKARADTAHEISKAYQSGLQDEANKQADQAQQGKARDIESVHATAIHARDSLRQQHAATLTTIGSAESTALRQAADARTSLSDSIAQTVAGGHQVLDQQEVSLTENVRAGARAQAATVEQQAIELSAAIQDQISGAVASLLDVGASLSAQVQGAAPPATEELQSALAAASAQLTAGVVGIQTQIEQGQAQGEEQLVQAGQAATDGLATSTQTGLDGANSGAADVGSSIASIATSAASAFQRIQDGHDSTLAETTTAATGGFNQVVTGVQQSYDEHARGLEQGFAQTAAGLEQGLRGALTKMDGEIRTKAEENAAAVPPRWKSVVKWILIIAVVVVVALVIGPFVIGAVGAALGTGAVMTGIIAGAIVGAATSATIQVINNWASNRPLGEGVVKAAVIGAIGGAVGGGFGAYFSSAAQAGTTVVNTAFRQFMANTAINVVTETTMNVITTGHFSWEALGMSALSAIAVGGALHAAGGIEGVKGIQESSMGAGESFGGSLRTGIGSFGGVRVAPPESSGGGQSSATNQSDQSGTTGQNQGGSTANQNEGAGTGGSTTQTGDETSTSGGGSTTQTGDETPAGGATTQPGDEPGAGTGPGVARTKPRAPAVPEGYEGGTGKLGKDLQWPTATSDGTPVSDLDLAAMRAKGITPEWARAEADNYRAHDEFNPNNPTAARRAAWLDALADRLSSEGTPPSTNGSGGGGGGSTPPPTPDAPPSPPDAPPSPPGTSGSPASSTTPATPTEDQVSGPPSQQTDDVAPPPQRPESTASPAALAPEEPLLTPRQRNRVDRLGDRLKEYGLTWEDIGVSGEDGLHGRIAGLDEPNTAIAELEARASRAIDLRSTAASEQARGVSTSDQPVGAEGTATEGLGPHSDPTVEAGRLPRTGGTWEGEPGNSTFASDHPDVIRVTNGGRVEFVDGEPVLAPYATEKVILSQMAGTDADFPAARRGLMQQYPGRWRNVTHMDAWERGVEPDNWGNQLPEQHTWHHEPDVEGMSLVPTSLHENIPHEGGASAARAGGRPVREPPFSTSPL